MHEPHYGMNRRTIDGRPHTGCYQEFPKGLAVAHELGVAGDLQQVVLQRTSERASEREREREKEGGYSAAQLKVSIKIVLQWWHWWL